MSKNRVSRADFAKIMGVDRSQPTRWAQLGMPSFEDGTLDAVACAAWVRANVDNYKIRGSVGAAQLRSGDRERRVREIAANHAASDRWAAFLMARLTLPLVPEPVARALAAEMQRQMHASSVECLDMDHRPPTGCATWADAPMFGEASPDAEEWAELLEQLEDGTLKVVANDA